MQDKKQPPLWFKQVYTESFKRGVIEEYLRTGTPKRDLLKKYNIRFHGAFSRWMRQLGYEDIYLRERTLRQSYPSMAQKKSAIDPLWGDREALEARIRELERRLEDEQLRSEAYSRMIDIAEQTLRVPIRKKPSTK